MQQRTGLKSDHPTIHPPHAYASRVQRWLNTSPCNRCHVYTGDMVYLITTLLPLHAATESSQPLCHLHRYRHSSLVQTTVYNCNLRKMVPCGDTSLPACRTYHPTYHLMTSSDIEA